MLIQVESVQEFEELAKAMGFVKAEAVKELAAPAKKKAPVKKKANVKPPESTPPEPKVEVVPDEVKQEVVTKQIDETIVTQADVLEYVKANYSDNVQGIKDMLDRVAAPKISEIKDDLCAKALSILKGE